MVYQGYHYFCNYSKDPKILKVIVSVPLTSYGVADTPIVLSVGCCPLVSPKPVPRTRLLGLSIDAPTQDVRDLARWHFHALVVSEFLDNVDLSDARTVTSILSPITATQRR